MEVKTVKSALEREIVRRDTEGDEVKQLQGQLDIVMNKLKDSKVIYEKIMAARLPGLNNYTCMWCIYTF